MCKATTKAGHKCRTKHSTGEYCWRHKPEVDLADELENLTIEEECVVCLETLDMRLSCGHPVHKQCVIKSGKFQCPVCRNSKLKGFTEKDLSELQKVKDKYKREYEEEEFQRVQELSQQMMENDLRRTIILAFPTLEQFVMDMSSDELYVLFNQPFVGV